MLAAALLSAAALVTSVHDVFPRGDAHSELRRVNPVTLAPAGAPVRLHGFLRGGHARSPDGRRLAPSVDRGRLQLVEGRASRIVRTAGTSVHWQLAWPRADRIVALGDRSIAVVDPEAGRVVRSAALAGTVANATTTADGLALLVSRTNAIAEATLLLVDAEGKERRIALAGVLAGFVPPDQHRRSRAVTPDLAVRDGVAYVATDTRVVAVDLATGAQQAHPFITAGAAKDADVTQRSIRVVGPHTVAVSGNGLGLRVVDTQTWAVTRIDGGARGSVALDGGGFAAWPSHRGLALYDADGRRRATLLRGRRLVQVQAVGRYAYAVATKPRHRTYVVDLEAERVVRTLPTAQPGRLISPNPPMIRG